MSIINVTTTSEKKYIHNLRQLSMSKRISWITRMAQAKKLVVGKGDGDHVSFLSENDYEDSQQDMIDNFVEYVTLMIECLNKIYPDNWDMIVRPVQYAYSFDSNYDTERVYHKYEIIPTIHYKNTTLTSENGGDHQIKDLFIGIPIRINHSKARLDGIFEFGIDSVLGFRSTLSFAEWNIGYFHSHLSSNTKAGATSILDFQSFCIGSGDISELIPQMNDPETLGFDEDNWGMFFSVVETMIKWESISGNPYIKIENISEATSKLIVRATLSDYDIKSYSNQTFNKLTVNYFQQLPKFTFSYNSGIFNVDFKEEHINALKEMLLQEEFCHQVIIKKEDGEIIGFKPDTGDDNIMETLKSRTTVNGQIPYFFFNGEKKYLKIEQPLTNNQDNNISNFHIRKEFLNKLKNEFNKEAYKQQVISRAKNEGAVIQS